MGKFYLLSRCVAQSKITKGLTSTAKQNIAPTELNQISLILYEKSYITLVALVRTAYLVWSDTFGTCLGPKRRQYFHSNHPVWLALEEACRTTTRHICVKSMKQVWRMSVTCLGRHACLCASACARWQGCKCFCVRVCVYTFLRGQREPDTSGTV